MSKAKLEIGADEGAITDVDAVVARVAASAALKVVTIEDISRRDIEAHRSVKGKQSADGELVVVVEQTVSIIDSADAEIAFILNVERAIEPHDGSRDRFRAAIPQSI